MPWEVTGILFPRKDGGGVPTCSQPHEEAAQWNSPMVSWDGRSQLCWYGKAGVGVDYIFRKSEFFSCFLKTLHSGVGISSSFVLVTEEPFTHGELTRH